ncbi:MAG: hypothetical protein AB7R55_10515 [Gemmatimonadales bacterium]
MMTKPATTLFVFAIYLILLGAALVVVPNTLLGLVGMPATTEVWIRIVGMLVMFLGVYYVVAARINSLPFMETSVRLRGSVLLFFGAFVALGWAPPALLLFAAIDVLGALWTHLSLRRELGGKPLDSAATEG